MHPVFNQYHFRRTVKPLKGNVDTGRMLLRLILRWGTTGYFTERRAYSLVGLESLWKPWFAVL